MVFLIFIFVAIFGSDYATIPVVSTTFQAGSGNGSTRCLSILVLEDGVIEPDETIFVSLVLLTTGRNVMLGNTTTTAVILMKNGG
jgi:hypothetical protein